MSRNPDDIELIGQSDGGCGTRRTFLFTAAAVALAGCGSEKTASLLPGPAWPSESDLHQPTEPFVPVVRDVPVPTTGVIGRSAWTKTAPTQSLMKPMLPVKYITLHHDAQVFTGTDTQSAAARIESIRRYHRNDRGWGDIGYHFVVDRAGRIWQGRPVNWQGAHVGDHNEGNIGVVALGNFDQQQPTGAQVEAVRRQILLLMSQYRVSLGNVKTHQEWAVTACPGRSMQQTFASLRSNGLRG